jgi:hypothetical protein
MWRPKDNTELRNIFYKETKERIGANTFQDYGPLYYSENYVEWLEEKLVATGFKEAAKQQTTAKVRRKPKLPKR